MSSRLTQTLQNGSTDRWHMMPHDHRIAILGSVVLMLLSVLSTMTLVDASTSADVSVGFIVTNDIMSSSSSSISSSVSSIASSNIATETNSALPSGGNSRRASEILAALHGDDIPHVLTRRMLPGCDTLVADWQIQPRAPHPISFCHRDDTPHAASRVVTTYTDVPAGIWYEIPLASFLSEGILDATQMVFRGNDAAKRAEFAKVLGKLHGNVPEKLTGTMHFDDIRPSEWFATFVEFAGTKGWMRGYNNCIGTHPCTVMPGSTITRAEAAAMIVRFHGLKPIGTAPAFMDVSADAWYRADLQTAADRCIVQGSGTTRLANPQERLNRAEMIVLLDRAQRKLRFGSDCIWNTSGNVSSASSRATRTDSSSSASASVSSVTSSFASVHPAAPLVTNDATPPNDMSGLAVATMIIMGFLTLTIVSRLLIS